MFANLSRRSTPKPEVPKEEDPLIRQIRLDLLTLDDFNLILERSGLDRNSFLNLVYAADNNYLEWSYREFTDRQKLYVEEKCNNVLLKAVKTLESVLDDATASNELKVQASSASIRLLAALRSY